MKLAKQKKPKKKRLRAAIKDQLDYVTSNIEVIGDMLQETGLDVLQEKRITRLMTICEVVRQQKQMLLDNTHKMESRIVNLRQPHIRPIVRGKSGAKYEFGQKLAFSVINGYTFIEKQSFDNFNEGVSLIESVERYKQVHGFYPEAVLADQIYRNRENLAYCKKNGIRLSGPKLGRPSSDKTFDRETEYRDRCERNIVESRNGIAKRRFGLDLIMAYLPGTSMTEAAFAVLCMNAHLRLFWRLFFIRLFGRPVLAKI